VEKEGEGGKRKEDGVRARISGRRKRKGRAWEVRLYHPGTEGGEKGNEEGHVLRPVSTMKRDSSVAADDHRPGGRRRTSREQGEGKRKGADGAFPKSRWSTVKNRVAGRDRPLKKEGLVPRLYPRLERTGEGEGREKNGADERLLVTWAALQGKNPGPCWR